MTDVNDPAPLFGQAGCADAMGGQPWLDGCPSVKQTRFIQAIADKMQEMISQDSDKQMAFDPIRLVMEVGTQTQLIFHTAKGVFDHREHDIDWPYFLISEIYPVSPQEIAAVVGFAQFFFIKFPADLYGILTLL